MTETNEELGKGMQFCCEVFRTDSEHYELRYLSNRGRPMICLVSRDGIDALVSSSIEHIVRVLERAALVPIRIETPEYSINLGARDWWDSITTHGTMIRMVAYGNKATDVPCGSTMPAKFWEKMDNQTIVEIVCQSAAAAEPMAEEIRRNILCKIELGGPVLQITHDDGLTVHAFGLTDAEIAGMNETHEPVGPCRWERGISIHFAEDIAIPLGRLDSLLRFSVMGRTIELRGPATSTSVTYVSEAVAAKAFHDLRTKPRSRLMVGDDTKQIYCQTGYGVCAEGIPTEEMARLDATCRRVGECEWSFADE